MSSLAGITSVLPRHRTRQDVDAESCALTPNCPLGHPMSLLFPVSLAVCARTAGPAGERDDGYGNWLWSSSELSSGDVTNICFWRIIKAWWASRFRRSPVLRGLDHTCAPFLLSNRNHCSHRRPVRAFLDEILAFVFAADDILLCRDAVMRVALRSSDALPCRLALFVLASWLACHVRPVFSILRPSIRNREREIYLASLFIAFKCQHLFFRPPPRLEFC